MRPEKTGNSTSRSPLVGTHWPSCGSTAAGSCGRPAPRMDCLALIPLPGGVEQARAWNNEMPGQGLYVFLQRRPREQGRQHCLPTVWNGLAQRPQWHPTTTRLQTAPNHAGWLPMDVSSMMLHAHTSPSGPLLRTAPCKLPMACWFTANCACCAAHVNKAGRRHKLHIYAKIKWPAQGCGSRGITASAFGGCARGMHIPNTGSTCRRRSA